MRVSVVKLVLIGLPLLLGCDPPEGSTLGPVSMEPSPAQGPPPSGAVPNSPFAPPYAGPPVQLSYSATPYPYPQFATVVGMATSIVPSVMGGSITSCTISPTLPAGLSFSSSNCSISGTPTAYSQQTLYSVAAYDGTTATSTAIALGVSPAGTAMIATSQSSYLLTVGESGQVTIEQGGGAASSDCATSSSMPGITRSGCTFSGTPSGASDTMFGLSDSDPIFIGFQVYPAWYHALGAGWEQAEYYTGNDFMIYAVNPSTEPVVTYGGTQLFTQAALTVGTAMTAITPTNTGKAITSCSASPSLPAGLSLSQSDCTVSGTPTATSAGTAYTITPTSGSTYGNPLTLNLSVEPATVHAMSCQSSTLCVHNLMPLWDQSDPALASYIHSQGYNVTSDPGWCGGVSAAMVINSYYQEMQTYTGLQSTTVPSQFALSQGEYPFILQSMIQVGTNIVGGGTDQAPNSGMVSLFGNCMQTDDLDSPDFYFPFNINPYENAASYRQGMPLGWVGVGQFTNPLGNAHALAVNGVDGNYIKIYDPWGTVYDATITVTFPVPSSGYPGTLSYVSGNSEDFVDEESNGTGIVIATDWITGYVYTPNGAPPSTQCKEP